MVLKDAGWSFKQNILESKNGIFLIIQLVYENQLIYKWLFSYYYGDIGYRFLLS